MLVDRHYRSDTYQPRTSVGRFGSDFRFATSSFRSNPYPRPHPPPPPGNSNDKWNHDLFEDDSNVYKPKPRKVDTSPPTTSEPQPSPSLRPFGKPHTAPLVNSRLFASTGLINQDAPAVQSAIGISSQTPAAVISQPPRAPISLLSRIQTGSKPVVAHQPIELIPNPAATSVFAPRNIRLDHTPSELREARELHDQKNRSVRAQKAYDLALAKYLSGPVVLEVSNLAEGTSAEDVKTAFADFGEIQECSTEEGPKQGLQATLKARMVFIHKSDADKAVEALNGVLADGLLLSVKIVSRVGKKPERADFQLATGSQLTSPPCALPAAPTQSDVQKADVEMRPAEDLAMDVDSTIHPPAQPFASKLRSEVVAKCDPRASLQSEPHPPPFHKPTPPAIPTPLLTERLKPASSSTPADDLMHSIGISSDAMKLMDRLQGGGQPKSFAMNRSSGKGSSSGPGRFRESRGGGGNAKPSLLARIGRD